MNAIHTTTMMETSREDTTESVGRLMAAVAAYGLEARCGCDLRTELLWGKLLVAGASFWMTSESYRCLIDLGELVAHDLQLKAVLQAVTDLHRDREIGETDLMVNNRIEAALDTLHKAALDMGEALSVRRTLGALSAPAGQRSF